MPESVSKGGEGVLLVGGGERPPEHVKEDAKELEVVALDQGAHWVLRWGLVPSRVVGDMDSLDRRSRAYADRYGTPLESWDPVVGRSDLSRMVDGLLESPPGRVVLTGCVGWRLDHVLGVFFEMARLGLAGVPVRLVERWGTAQVAAPGVRAVWEDLAAERASFYPLSGRVEGLKLSGFDEVEIPDPWAPPGPPAIAVPIVSDPAEVDVAVGAVVTLVPRREDPEPDESRGGTPTFRLGTNERTQ